MITVYQEMTYSTVNKKQNAYRNHYQTAKNYKHS